MTSAPACGARVERRRVAEHIEGAEELVRRPQRLPPLQLLNRSLLLQELEQYRTRGLFPKNTDFRGKCVPYFVDAEGTRCAVAHLLDVSDQGELVRYVAARNNHVKVTELASNAEFVAWLAAAGLTLEEAARIQPSYDRMCHGSFADLCYCDRAGVDTVALATVVRVGANQDPDVVRLEQIEGQAGNRVIGDEILVQTYNEVVGDQVVLSGQATDGGLIELKEFPQTVAQGQVQCITGGPTQPPALDFTAVADVLLADDAQCRDTLVSMDSHWLEEYCTGGGGDDMGCALRHAVSPASLPSLSAIAVLLGILHYRRSRRFAK